MMLYGDPNDELFNKMTAEQEKYKEQLLKKSPEEILENAFDYAIREDILFSFEANDLTEEQAEALLKTDTPLADILQTFADAETSHMEDIWDSVERRADEMIAAQCAAIQGELKSVPLYLHDVYHAQQNGEMELYYASFQANVACRDAIDTAIREHYHDNRLGAGAVPQVVEQFGMKRTLHVLAATARHKEWDQRISHENKVWAFSMPDPDPSNRSAYYVVHQSHPGLVNLFIGWTREMEQKQQRPSVREQLKKAVPIPSASKTTPKEPER